MQLASFPSAIKTPRVLPKKQHITIENLDFFTASKKAIAHCGDSVHLLFALMTRGGGQFD